VSRQGSSSRSSCLGQGTVAENACPRAGDVRVEAAGRRRLLPQLAMSRPGSSGRPEGVGMPLRESMGAARRKWLRVQEERRDWHASMLAVRTASRGVLQGVDLVADYADLDSVCGTGVAANGSRSSERQMHVMKQSRCYVQNAGCGGVERCSARRGGSFPWLPGMADWCDLLLG
jgi:hypothetical protein